MADVLFDQPLLLLAVLLPGFWAAAWVGIKLRQAHPTREEKVDDDFSFVLGGALTLLGLLVGFSFSMAVGRYDLRKTLEEAEANAIGTEEVRADLLPAGDAARVRELLRSYVDQRILFYTARDAARLRQIDADTARLQAELWSVVARHASVDSSPIAALVVAGMNDVLNSQGYTQAAWWNRIPQAAWALLLAIAVFCNGLIGYHAHGRGASLLLILPIALSITLFLIADIDSPRGGVIRVHPQNLESLAASLRAS
ncbi:MAG TPA: hypothetical protein VM753_10725 [Anaeromyxobacter sp.]|jgi:hypothetical protein|nr:hypothetical protein [Anaeromyxobacter sp.]